MNQTPESVSKKPRYLFLDNIKVLFTILVIYWHVMVTYVEAGWWYYKESNPTDIISFMFLLLLVSIGGIFQTSLLGLFFLLGGYFTPNSYGRKGGYSFWKDRLVRLGIPLVLYVILINPLMIYTLAKLGIPPWNTSPLLQGSFLDYYYFVSLSLNDFINFLSFSGPMWFLKVLLLLTAFYTLWRLIIKSDTIKRRIPQEFPIPRYLYLLLIAIGLGAASFLVRIFYPIDARPLEIPLGQMIQYSMMFCIGVISVRYLWFEKMTRKHVKLWLAAIAVSVAMIYIDFFFVLGIDADLTIFQGGLNPHAFLFALVDSIVCMGVIFALIKVFYAKFNKQGSLLQNMSASAYHMYLVHPPILVALAIGISSLNIIPIVKIAIVFSLAILLCYLVSHYVTTKIHMNR